METTGSATLAVSLPSDREIVIRRTFDAPRRLVWAAWTDPAHLPHWLTGPEGWTLEVRTMDLRPGGAWHYVWRHADGGEMEMRGTYREVAAPERLVTTESWGHPWPETLNTLVLSEEGGGTTATLTVLYPSGEARDAALGTGMTGGLARSYDRLDDHLDRLRSEQGTRISANALPVDPVSPVPLVITVRRKFDAAAEQLFDAWLDPAAAGRWLFATPGGEMQRVEIDPRVGGGFTVVERRGEELAEHFGTYLEIDRPRRLVFSFATHREAEPDRVTVEIAPAGDGCELTLIHEMDPSWAEHAERTRAGWTDILARLGATVPDGREIVLTRAYDAPRELVWRAWTEPEHVAQWWGPYGFTTTVREMEVRPGGVWRYTMHGPDGTDYPNRITYREVVRPERLVYDHDDDGAGEHAFHVAVAFEAEGAGTRVTMRMRLASAEQREAMVRFGAVEGGNQTLARLAEHLAAL